MFSYLKTKIKKSNKLYILLKSIESMNDPALNEMLRGYYESSTYDEASTMIVHHLGNKEPDKLVAGISIGAYGAGLMSNLRYTLLCLNWGEILGAIPTVMWSREKSMYYDKGMDSITNNVFEYYFNPVSKIKYESLNNYANVLFVPFWGLFGNYEDLKQNRWFYNEQILARCAYVYNKYIKLNDMTRSYIDEQIANLFKHAKRVIGVHVRGTDYALKMKNHPVMIQPKEHVEKVKELLKIGEYDKIFLATDDAGVIELFNNEFQNKLIYYTDTIRSDSIIGVHSTTNNRTLHHYRLGLEVLRDVYTLAQCDALVCGLSNVPYAARYLKMSMDKEYDNIIVLDHGFNSEDSKKAKENIKNNKKVGEKRSQNS